MIHRQYGKHIKIVRSDNGTEFTCLTSEFREQGIVHQTSCVGTPQQNGRVERKHRHILNVARALLFQSSFSTKFWGESVLTAVYLINRTPSRLLGGKTPYEILHRFSPNYDNLRVFGCLAYAHNQRRHGDKFESRSRKCLFIGYPFGKKGWSLYDLASGEVFVSRDVVFVENTFPLLTEKVEETWRQEMEDFDCVIAGNREAEFVGTDMTRNAEIYCDVEEEDVTTGEKQTGLLEKETEVVVLPRSVVANGDVESQNQSQEESVGLSHSDVDSGIDEDGAGRNEISEADPNIAEAPAGEQRKKVRKSTRSKTAPVKLKDYVLRTVAEIDMSGDENDFSILKFVDISEFSAKHRAFVAAITKWIELKHCVFESQNGPTSLSSFRWTVVG
ncbi:PREDICTED: uncharacterized protein LOC109125890 [Camelina sativa]|uniref:Uncharacterized protein LOC109125890 n=1 Tax=Camelina sativa TaxID=90675 RepID=A0ABM1QBS8_CAMSA|nr:PREDICTED: uncharacterized protein LOC109125890 [Camelina sativa]